MTKSQARQALESLLRPLNEGVYSPVQRMTFGAFCDRWEKEILTHYPAVNAKLLLGNPEAVDSPLL
jgi:hypothetical protein